MSNSAIHILSLEGSDSTFGTFDPASLATIFILQLLHPGQYSLHAVKDVSNAPHGELSTNLEWLCLTRNEGYIPYLVRRDEGSQKRVVSTFDSISAHLGSKLDSNLTEEENAKSIAWKACIYCRLGDLVVSFPLP